MKTLVTIALAGALALAAPGFAADKTKSPEGITREQADKILDELKQIRQLLEKQAKPAAAQEEAPTRAKVADLSGLPVMGSPTAPITIVEFTDYQCPFCQRFHVTSFPELKSTYIDTGKVRFYSKDMPLDFHPNAMRAATAARCAAEQGKFWELRSIMAANPDQLGLDQIVGYADKLSMDSKKLKACVESNKYKDAVQADVLEAMRIGANGTPTFIVGKSAGNGVEGELVIGAQPFAMFDARLKELMK